LIVVNFTEGSEVHPNEFLIVNEYVPVFNSLKITLVVPEVPVIVAPPGLAVTVHAPLDGNPLNDTLPVGFVHVGCVFVPTTGGLGKDGFALIVTDIGDDIEAHPNEFVTVNVYIPVANPLKVV
jgi:hypothetical protein